MFDLHIGKYNSNNLKVTNRTKKRNYHEKLKQHPFGLLHTIKTETCNKLECDFAGAKFRDPSVYCISDLHIGMKRRNQNMSSTCSKPQRNPITKTNQLTNIPNTLRST